jgi:outer membrane protein
MKKIFFICLMMIFSNQIVAAENNQKSYRVAIGYGMAFKNNLRFDNEYVRTQSSLLHISIPLFNINYGPLNIGAGGISLAIFGDRDKSLYINTNRFGERYYGPGMHSRKDGWSFGFGGKWKQTNLSVHKDISGNSKGIKIALAHSYPYIIDEKNILRSSIFVDFYNQKYADYYYGVLDYEVRSGRPQYTGKAFITPGASLFYTYLFNQHANMLIGTAIKKIPDSVSFSPTMKKTDFEVSLILGPSWIF